MQVDWEKGEILLNHKVELNRQTDRASLNRPGTFLLELLLLDVSILVHPLLSGIELQGAASITVMARLLRRRYFYFDRIWHHHHS